MNENNGMITYIWGPALWHSLHTISFNYPIKPTNNDIENYYNFFIGLKNVLPCKACRINYENNLKKLKFSKNDLKNREKISRFIYKLHEQVNTDIGKKSGLTYNNVKEKYESFRAECTKDTIGCTVAMNKKKKKCVLKVVNRKSSTNIFS